MKEMKTMDEHEIDKLIKTIDTNVVPPKGLKNRMLAKIIGLHDDTDIILNPVEKFIFEKPLFTAGGISVSISGLLWIIMGSGFNNLVSGLIK